MKINQGLFVTLLCSIINVSTAFTIPTTAGAAGRATATKLQSTVDGEKANWDLNAIAGGMMISRCEGNTRKTFNFQDVSQDVVQVGLKSEGRPIEAEIQLWIGPDWTPFTLKCFSEDGSQFPVQTLLGTRNKESRVEVRNVGPYEMPLSAAASYAPPQLAAVREIIPMTEPARTVQGGGAVHYVPVDGSVDQVRVFINTDTRQLNVKVELLNGPNNIKQTYETFTNNGVLNSFYAVFETPGDGNTIRITNLATVEFPAYAYTSPV